jgi:hypothetical protein
VPVIDATAVVMSIHQDHERTYTSMGVTAPGGIDDLRKGIEFRQNLRLAGGWPHVFTPRNANWLLTRHWLLPALTPLRLWRRFKSSVRLLLAGLTRVLIRWTGIDTSDL